MNKFAPILNCSVAARGRFRWSSPTEQTDLLEMIDTVITRRVHLVLTTMDYDEKRGFEVWKHMASIQFGRMSDAKIGYFGLEFLIQPTQGENVEHLVRTAILYRDQHGRLGAEGDLGLIAEELGVMKDPTGTMGI